MFEAGLIDFISPCTIHKEHMSCNLILVSTYCFYQNSFLMGLFLIVPPIDALNSFEIDAACSEMQILFSNVIYTSNFRQDLISNVTVRR